jgi:hypothetical protein
MGRIGEDDLKAIMQLGGGGAGDPPHPPSRPLDAEAAVELATTRVIAFGSAG